MAAVIDDAAAASSGIDCAESLLAFADAAVKGSDDALGAGSTFMANTPDDVCDPCLHFG